MRIPDEKIAEWKAWAEGGERDDPPPPSDVLDILAERESLLSLLREREWSDSLPNIGAACYTCRGANPENYDRWRASGTPGPQWDGFTVRRGHAPDCRLAAFLKE